MECLAVQETLASQVIETYQNRPKTAILMSGQGTNAQEILNNESLRDLYNFNLVISDNKHSNTVQIGQENGVPTHVDHTPLFRNMIERTQYFSSLSDRLHSHGVEAVIYAGFMKIAPSEFCRQFPGVNIHPADLTLLGTDGLPLFRGMDAMSKMRKQLEVVRSTVHVVDTPLDSGQSISLSDILHPNPVLTDTAVHALLKEKEHQTYTTTLQILGNGAITEDMMPLTFAQMQEIKGVR